MSRLIEAQDDSDSGEGERRVMEKAADHVAATVEGLAQSSTGRARLRAAEGRANSPVLRRMLIEGPPPSAATDEPGLRAAADAVIASWDDKWVGCAEMSEPLERLRAALAATPAASNGSLDVERLARALEAEWPGWLDEAPDSDAGRAEIREYAASIATRYRAALSGETRTGREPT